MRDRDLRWRCFHACQEFPQAIAQIGILLKAGGHCGAAREQPVQCALRIDRDTRSKGKAGRHNPVQDDSAHTFRISLEVVLRDPRAVGDSVDVERRVAERLPHQFEIVHRRTRREERRIVRQPVNAFAAEANERCRVEKYLVALDILAAQRRGGPGAPLVDQDDVPRSANPCERGLHLGIEDRRSLAGAARDQREGIRLRRTGERGNPCHQQFDPFASRPTRIERHFQCAALGRRFGPIAVRGQDAGFEIHRRQRTTCPQQQRPDGNAPR